MNVDVAQLRKEYSKAQLDIESVASTPYEQFRDWFDEAVKSELLEPNAMVLSTVENNCPSQRTVLMKALDEKGITFFTNYESRKARQIEANNKVSVLFPWYALERQVAISGTVEKVSKKESLAYFLSRPFSSQLGAWVSQQSSVISSRNILETKLEEMKRKFQEGKVPIPDFWGGFRIIPQSYEFWQGRKSRLHDRILYEKIDNQWSPKRLSP